MKEEVEKKNDDNSFKLPLSNKKEDFIYDSFISKNKLGLKYLKSLYDGGNFSGDFQEFIDELGNSVRSVIDEYKK